MRALYLILLFSFPAFSQQKDYNFQRICIISDDGNSCTEPGTGRVYVYKPLMNDTIRENNLKLDIKPLDIEKLREGKTSGGEYHF